MSQRVPPWSLLLVFLSLLGQLPCRSQGQESQAQQWLDAVSSVPTIVPVSNGRQLYEALQRVNETDMVLQLTRK